MALSHRAMRKAMKRSIKQSLASRAGHFTKATQLRMLEAKNFRLVRKIESLEAHLSRSLTSEELTRIARSLHQTFPDESIPIAATPKGTEYAITLGVHQRVVLWAPADGDPRFFLVHLPNAPILLPDGSVTTATDALRAVAAYDGLAGG